MQFGVSQFQFPEVAVDNFVVSEIPEKLRLGHQMEFVCKQLLEASNAHIVQEHIMRITCF